MTAIGVALLMLGTYLGKDYPYTTDTQDVTSGLILMLGGLLTSAGVLVWLWRVMP